MISVQYINLTALWQQESARFGASSGPDGVAFAHGSRFLFENTTLSQFKLWREISSVWKCKNEDNSIALSRSRANGWIKYIKWPISWLWLKFPWWYVNPWKCSQPYQTRRSWAWINKKPFGDRFSPMLLLFSQVWSSVCFSKLKGACMETQGTVWESDYGEISALPEGARLTPQWSFVEFILFTRHHVCETSAFQQANFSRTILTRFDTGERFLWLRSRNAITSPLITSPEQRRQSLCSISGLLECPQCCMKKSHTLKEVW